jgi:hypothetical protein
VDAGSIAFGSWNNNQHTGDPNLPGVGSAATSRAVVPSSCSRTPRIGSAGATPPSRLSSRTLNKVGPTSYVYGGDLNGDGGTSNDLIYVPRDQSEMNFLRSLGRRAVHPGDAGRGLGALHAQDPYLRTRRGQYAERRGGLMLPQVTRMDLSASQDLSALFAGKKNSLQLRVDILNFTNMLNSDWGLAQFAVNNAPLIPRAAAAGGPADGTGAAIYTMRVINGQLQNRTFQKSANVNDVWRMQVGLRYTFN